MSIDSTTEDRREDHHRQEADHTEADPRKRQDYRQVETFQAYFQEDKEDLEEDQEGSGTVRDRQWLQENRQDSSGWKE